FVGTGVDAHLGLDGVTDHASIVITVRVSGSQAELEDGQGNDNGDDHNGDDDNNNDMTEGEGHIVAASLAGSCANHTLSFTVGTTRITTNASTQFEDGTCQGLTSGTEVEVKGAHQTNGSLLAAKVESEGEHDDSSTDLVIGH